MCRYVCVPMSACGRLTVGVFFKLLPTLFWASLPNQLAPVIPSLNYRQPACIYLRIVGI